MTLRWPLPALLSWAAAWLVFATLSWFGAAIWVALVSATSMGVVLALLGGSPWRRIFIAGGFPLSLLVSGFAGAASAWVWLLPLTLLAVIYPINAWRDAPLFPTPAGALRGLAELLPLPAQARIVDAGCGLGAGLHELRREYPNARIEGLEWSWPLRWVCAWRCRFARVQRADIWKSDWSGHDMVYLFQRPESMLRAADKAVRELRRGAWLASLEFPVPRLKAQQVLQCPDGRRVWLYQAPFRSR